MRGSSGTGSPFSRSALALLLAGSLAGCGSALRQAPPASGDDSVSIGYGRQQAGNVSSAVGSVTAQQAADLEPVRIQDMLRRVPGIEVLRLADGSLSVRVRGAGGLGGDGEPLFVVDGMPLPRGKASTALDGIAPRDVDRIDVLKDGAAAIYGSQGVNGVVLIVTKHGG